MKNTIKKIFKITLLTFIAAILTIMTIVLFPQRLFANNMRYKQFNVCSNNKIDDNIKIVLDNAIKLVKKSELYDSTYNYNIILCHNTFYNKIDDKLLGYGPAARATLNNIIIKVRIDLKNNLAFLLSVKHVRLI